ncbi:hypothetical protein BD779DRAFT_1147810 [Infundibulicybe gibba]|nr:hypothetical protein BD779DRAFT_1147810 [Infundibulicybe gibba]
MVKSNAIVLLLPALALASLAPRDGRIPSLLRHGMIGSSRALGVEVRQSGCAFAGDFECPDGQGCCSPGTYCDDIGGCCDNGETCIAGSGKCPNTSDVRCTNGCCPAGWTCSGANKCSPPSSGGGGGGNTIIGATLTRTVTTPLITTRTTTATSLTGTSFHSGGQVALVERLVPSVLCPSVL